MKKSSIVLGVMALLVLALALCGCKAATSLKSCGASMRWAGTYATPAQQGIDYLPPTMVLTMTGTAINVDARWSYAGLQEVLSGTLEENASIADLHNGTNVQYGPSSLTQTEQGNSFQVTWYMNGQEQPGTCTIGSFAAQTATYTRQ